MEREHDLRMISTYRGAIMGFAALWICVFHEWTPIIDTPGLLQSVEKHIKQFGFCGVDLFFFLSGIGLSYSMAKHSVLTFYKRRLSRVILPYGVTAVAMMIGQGWSAAQFLGNVSGYFFWTKSIYSFLWFVPAILTIYLLFPLYHAMFQKAPDKYQLTLAVLVVWLFLSLILEFSLRYDFWGFTNRLPVFFVGVLAGWLIRERNFRFTCLTWAVTGLLFCLGFFLARKTNFEGYYFLVSTSNCCVPNFLMSISGCCLLAKLFSILDDYGGKLGKGILRVLGLFGKMSLELYCVQEWVGGGILAVMQGRFDSKWVNLAVFAGIFVAMALLYGICYLIRTAFARIPKPVKVS